MASLTFIEVLVCWFGFQMPVHFYAKWVRAVSLPPFAGAGKGENKKE